MSEESKFSAVSKGPALGLLKANLGDQLSEERVGELRKEIAEGEREGANVEVPEMEPEDEELALGGFRPASDVLNEAEEQDIGTADTTAMSKSDPPAPAAPSPTPAPVVAPRPESLPDDESDEEEYDEYDGCDDEEEEYDEYDESDEEEEARGAPAVTPEDLHAADVDLGAASFFRPRDEQAPPPFEATRLTDPGSVPPAAPVADGSTDDRHPPRTPRPPNRRIEVPIVTPETIERREKLETWKRWGCALLVLCFLAIIVAVVVVVGMSAVSWATERGWIGDEVVETERETVRPPERVTVADPETEPPVVPVTPVAPLEEARPVRPVMPPPVIEPPPVVRPTTVPEPDEPSRRPVCRRIEGIPGRLLYRCE